MNPAAPSPCRYCASFGSRCTAPAVVHGYCEADWPFVRAEAWNIAVGCLLRSAISLRDSGRELLRYATEEWRPGSVDSERCIQNAVLYFERAAAVLREVRKAREEFRQQYPRTPADVAVRRAHEGWTRTPHTESRRREVRA